MKTHKKIDNDNIRNADFLFFVEKTLFMFKYTWGCYWFEILWTLGL